MPTICRLIRLSPEEASGLVANPGPLPDHLAPTRVRSDVYRYWHAIEYLLAQHRPGGAAAKWLAMGTTVSPATAEVPGSRVLSAAQVRELAAELREVNPEHLAEYYDSSTLDAAGIYPSTWREWEEDFDPLGQVLEHYFFLQEFVTRSAEAGAAVLLQFDVLAEGEV